MSLKQLFSFSMVHFKNYNLKGSYKALDVAKYIVNKCSVENIPISNLQLQKILYYTQRFFLQVKRRALFVDEIEAWSFGPVVREVYDYFCGFGYMNVFYLQIGESSISKEDSEFIDKIIDEKLNNLINDIDIRQKGKAWDLIYRDGCGHKEVIPKRLIADQ